MNHYCLRVMDSKSWPTLSTVQCRASSRHLGRPTDPMIYAVEECRSEGSKKTFKKNSEESLERASKRSRTSHSPSEGCSQIFSWPSSSDDAASSSSAYTSPIDSTADCHTGSGETPSISGSSNGAVLGTGKIKTSIHRKSTSDESEEGPRKRKENPSSAEDCTQTFSSSFSTESKKRKSEKTEGPRKRSRKTPRHQATTEASSSDKPGTSSSANNAPPDSRAAFEAKYEEEELLGEGGFGSVFAGHRKDDNLPVAIKHIPQFDITRTSVFLDGKISMIPLEVALLLKVKPAAAGSSAAITLLDWYDLDYELILILERPVPCLDLIEYMNYRGSTLQEHEAKTIAKQLVDALIEVHSRGVFHGDIKLDNILIETDSDVPRIRLIDFGCGTFLSEGIYTTKQATYMYTTPEWFLDGWYRAEPTTVWQLGVVLFAILHGYLPFSNSTEIVYGNPDISNRLSFDCQGFLLSCLIKGPEARPTLETLKQLPWLI
ncbi:serine/threonine-protein kinase pim-2-like isoform X2 [Siniperca chuatsi]|uniref:serine/threonine-protein kinase pim-2-like isoform X2 n=1 Tax=Siniperca chuatsi TaxID=119488 RepID=UPI001CE1D1BB|nr:serine/threonine-protein kinase pim-2-like isoform X2 [Siniperca chuatsi]